MSALFTINKNPDEAVLKKFGWAMLIGFGVLGAILWVAPAVKAAWDDWSTWDASLLAWVAGGKQITAVCLWSVGAALWLLTLVAPMAAKPIYVGWMSVAVPVGIAVSTLFLTLLFFIVLPLFSIVVRAGDPLRRKLTRGDTYWEDHKPYEPTLERMNRLF
jgi:hypothetical protein